MVARHHATSTVTTMPVQTGAARGPVMMSAAGEVISTASTGEPIPLMVERVKRWLAEGREVRIFTARVAVPEPERRLARGFIVDWCRIHIGVALEVTNVKDFGMVELWDDRAVSVGLNTGMRLDGRTE